MGITYKPTYHMYWTTDCILPFYWGLQINPCIICTGQQTVYYPPNGGLHINPCIIWTGQKTVNYPSNRDYT